MSAEPTTIAVIGGGLAALILVQQLREQLADSTHAVQLLVIDPAGTRSVLVAVGPMPLLGSASDQSWSAAMPSYSIARLVA